MPWGQTAIVPSMEQRAPVLSLREVMAQEEIEAAKQLEDRQDMLLQAALAQSIKESEKALLPTLKKCLICTFLNKSEMLNCEMCTSELPEVEAVETDSVQNISKTCETSAAQEEGVKKESDIKEEVEEDSISSDADFALALSLNEASSQTTVDSIDTNKPLWSQLMMEVQI